MPWTPNPELAQQQPIRGWFDAPEIPEQHHDTGWFGIKKVAVPEAMSASAQMYPPTITSGATVKVPGRPQLKLPFKLPARLRSIAPMTAHAELHGGEIAQRVTAPIMQASAEFHAPTVTSGEDRFVEPPTMSATADMPTPTPQIGVTVHAPTMRALVAKSLPFKLPHRLGKGGFFTPTVTATNQVSPQPFSAAAQVYAPDVSSGSAVEASAMQASAELLVPEIRLSPATVGPPTMGATAALNNPSVASGGVGGRGVGHAGQRRAAGS